MNARHRGLSKSPEVRNVAWLLVEYGLRVGLVFVATALVARHLGPEQFGSFSLLYTLIVLVLPFTDAGLNHLVSREIVANARPLEVVLGTSAGLRLASCLLGVPILVGLAAAAGDGYPMLVAFAALSGLLNAVTSLAVIDYYFQSALRARLSVIARTAALALVSGAQITLIVLDAGVAPFLATLALQQPLFGVLYYIVYRIDGGGPVRRWSFERRYARQLFGRSVRLTGANILNALSVRAPVLFLAQFGTPTQVGILGAATRPVDMLTVLSNALGATLLPRFVRTHKRSPEDFDRLLRRSTAAFTALGTAMTVALIVAAPVLVGVLYGPEFADAARVMQIYAPFLIFLYFRGVMSKWMITEERFNLSIFSQGLGAVVAVLSCLVVLQVGVSAGAVAVVLVGQAVAASLLALALTGAGRAYLGVVFLGRSRRVQSDDDPEGSTTT